MAPDDVGALRRCDGSFWRWQDRPGSGWVNWSRASMPPRTCNILPQDPTCDKRPSHCSNPTATL